MFYSACSSTAQNEDHYDDYEDEDDDYEDDDFHVLKTYLANGHYQDPFTRPVPWRRKTIRKKEGDLKRKGKKKTTNAAACFSPSLWLLHSLLLIQLCRLIFV
ncbi:hypothetical protein GJAV_G00104740 [Gymnothorax javanicus]|nr:hypothetical protein GJAV_G00104740 [Gymnothorax javanicus]